MKKPHVSKPSKKDQKSPRRIKTSSTPSPHQFLPLGGRKKSLPKKKRWTVEELIKREALQGQDDLFYFAKHVLHYNLIESSVHQELCDILSFKHASYPSRKKLVLLPRDTFKSTIGTVALPIHLLTRQPNLSILIHCEVFTAAKAFLSEIKARIEDPTFQEKYGNWIPARNDSHRYTENLIEILPKTRRTKEGSISCSGVDKSITGSHFDVVICDDLVGETNSNTPEQLEKTIKNFTLVSESILKKGGILIVIGTRWHDADVYGHILETNKATKEYDVIVRPAVHTPESRSEVDWPIKPTSKFFFPNRLDEATLLKKWANLDNDLFFSQYLLDSTPKGAANFQREWFQYYNELPKDERLNFFITVDPSTKTQHGDYTAICTIAVDQYLRWYLADMVRDKLDPSELIELLFVLNDRFHPLSVGIEAVSFQQTLVHFLRKEQIARGKYIPIRELVTSTQITKEQRIRSLIPYFKQGRIFFPNPPTSATTSLIYELTRFPKAKFDDCADSLSYMPQLIVGPAAIKPIEDDKPFHEKMWDLIHGREKTVPLLGTPKEDPKWMQ